MKSRRYVFIYLNHRTAKGPVRRYWVNKPLQKLDEIWEIKQCRSDMHFQQELRRRLHALTFPYRFWTGDFNREQHNMGN